MRTLCLVVLLAGWISEGQAAPTAGGWIGWADLGDGGDLPLRVWLSDGPAGLSARFDGVPWREAGWPADLRVTADHVLLSAQTPRGSSIRLEGTCDGGRWAGTIAIADYAGEFELLHAPGLADVGPDQYADVAGLYRMSDGDILEARTLDWGEIMVRSLRTGEQRTLLPTGEDRFLTGPARYVPTPMEARYEIVRDLDGAIREVVRRPTVGQVTRGRPFALRREDVVIESDGAALAGTITRPDDDLPRPGVVVLGGSSWETRTTHAFHVRTLAALGFVVVHWDKRGFGDSGGSATVPFSTTASDGVAAATLLRERTDVTTVGYFGVSRGGWTAPLAVSRDDAAAFLVLFVPPAASPAVQEQGARLARMRREEYDASEVELAERLLEAAWRFVETDTDETWETYHTLYERARRRGVPEDVLPPQARDPEAWQWSRMNMLFDPQPVLRQIRVPVLAVFAEEDLNVLTDVHRPLLDEALEKAGNQDVTLVTVPGVAHDLGRPHDGPHHRWPGAGPEGFDVVWAWSRDRGLLPRSPNPPDR